MVMRSKKVEVGRGGGDKGRKRSERKGFGMSWVVEFEVEGAVSNESDPDKRKEKEWKRKKHEWEEEGKEKEERRCCHSRVVSGGQTTPSSSPFDPHNLIHSPLGSTRRSSLGGGPYFQGRRTSSVQVLR